MRDKGFVMRAEMFAKGAHAGQEYGNRRPYWVHLQAAAETVERLYRAYQFTGDLTLLKCGAWLHDTIEDTPVKYQYIKDAFDEEIAELVWSVTDEAGRNRKERNEKTRAKTYANRNGVIVKLADITANVEDAFQQNTKFAKALYACEWRETRQWFSVAFHAHKLPLAPELDRLEGIIVRPDDEPARDRRGLPRTL